MKRKTYFTLQFSKQYLHQNRSLHLLRSEKNIFNLYAVENDLLINWQFNNATWHRSQRNLLTQKNNVGQHVFSISENKDLLISIAINNICMYVIDKNDLDIFSSRCVQDSIWNLNEGNFYFGRFYDDINKMGLFVIRPISNRVEFYQTLTRFVDFVFDSESSNVDDLKRICTKDTIIFLAQLRKQLKQTIICRDDYGLFIFEFDNNENIKYLTRIPYEGRNVKKDEKIFFANLSGTENWMDIVAFTNNGLFIFKYHAESSIVFKMINYNPMFSEAKGWNTKHIETVRFEDIDNDGFDDMIFTGPTGIEILSYDLLTNKWFSLLNIENLSAQERHTIVLHVLPIQAEEENITNAILHSFHSDNMHTANIVSIPAEMIEIPHINRKYQMKFSKSSLLPKISNRKQNESNSILYMRDQNIWFDPSNSMNPKTGKPTFFLPLVSELKSTLKFHLFYDGSKTVNSQFGIGWSTPQNFIISGYRDSNFREDETYVLIIDDYPYQLERNPEMSTSNEIVFKFQAKNVEQTVCFQQNNNIWIVDMGNDQIQFYGYFDGQFGATITDISWENWRGMGIDSIDTVERTNIWYISATYDKGFMSFYKYQIFQYPSHLSDHLYYNAGAILISISNPLSQIQFTYNVQDESSAFHPYLSSFFYKTKTKEQMISFNYMIIGKSVFLTTIEQKNDYISKPLLQMNYENVFKKKYLLKKLILPKGIEINYSYKALGNPFSSTNGKKTRKIPVTDDYNVSYGPHYTLLSYLDKKMNKVIIRMFKNDMTEEIFPILGEWPKLNGPNTAETYEVITDSSFFVIIIYNSPAKSMFCFGNENGKWRTPPRKQDLHEQATILKGRNFILFFSENLGVYCLEWIHGENLWLTFIFGFSDRSGTSIAVDNNKIAIYDDEYIYLGFKAIQTPDRWTLRKLKYLPSLISGIENVLKLFALEKNFELALLAVFRNNVVQLSNNIIVLNTILLENISQLSTQITTLVIGRNHGIVIENSTIVVQDDILQLISDLQTSENGGNVNYGYKFKLNRVGNISSKSGLQIGQNHNQMPSTAKQIIFDIKNYHVSLYGQTVECRNVKFVFGGVKWYRHEIPKASTFDESISIRLGDRFVVNKADANSNVKLHDVRNNRLLFDFGVKNINETQINYPIYMASQNSNGREPVNVIEFIDGDEPEFRKTTLSITNELSPFGNAFSMVTHETHSVGNKTITIWPMYGIDRYLPNYVISLVETVIPGESGGSKERITGYQYQETSAQLIGDRINYAEVSIYPGNDKSLFGYIRITNQSVEYFNSEDQLVKRNQHPSERGHQSGESISDEDVFTGSIIYDKTDRYEIANFFPYSIASNMSDFIGFEDYEKPNNHWIYNPQDIVKGQFSLTGQNYLHLSGKSMKGVFIPEFQDRNFIISTWIRIDQTEKTLNTGDIVPYLRVSILNSNRYQIMNILSDIKYQINDWFYIEVFVDLHAIHFALRAATLPQSILQIEVRISPLPNSPIDLDHIRFCTSDNIFDVNVYDNEIGKLISVIKSKTGAITRFFYNEYLEQIAEINESNQIKEFRTYSKAFHNFEKINDQISNEIQIIPEKGFYENFYPNQLEKNWKITNIDLWDISPGTLQHYGNIPSYLFLKSNDIDENSYGIRFLYSLKEHSVLKIPDIVIINFESDTAPKRMFPNNGEILLLREGNRVIFWINGRLIMDQHVSILKSFQLTVMGDMKIQHMMVFNRPQVHVFYKNSLNENIQKLSLITCNTAIIMEMLFDEIGRQRITTVPVVMSRSPSTPLLGYDPNFVTNNDPKITNSVWRTGRMKGKICQIFGNEYGFSEIVYAKNPLNIQQRIGLAGEEFTVFGKYSVKFGSTTTNRFILNQYPSTENYRYQVQYWSDGREIISVFDEYNLKVAKFIHVEGAKDKLNVYEYNENGLMIKCIPPLYYDRMGIFNEASLDLIKIPSNNENSRMDIRISYDSRGNPITFKSPEKGFLRNIFDNKQRLRFVIQYFFHNSSEIESIVYFDFNELEQLSSTGQLKPPFQYNDVQLLMLKITVNNSHEFQRFHYSNFESDPAFRGQILRSITNNDDKTYFEETILNVDNHVIAKRIIEPNGSEKPNIISINKFYNGDFLKEILYPTEMFGGPFRLVYEYNKVGQMISIGIPGQTNRFMTITYNSRSLIDSELFTPMHTNKFIRTYKYMDCGFLTQINDQFLSQDISYTSNSYDNRGYGDGTITRIVYTARWHELSNRKGIGLNENSLHNNDTSTLDSEKCFHELKNADYLDSDNQQKRIFYPDLHVNLSNVCTNGEMVERVKQVFGQYGFPKRYGYRYFYGAFMELRKAKYFVGNINEESTAFQENTFSTEITDINEEKSKKIWNNLKLRGYIQEDRHGNWGISFIRKSLIKDLEAISPDVIKYAPLIKKLILHLYLSSLFKISHSQWNTYTKHWFENDETSRSTQIYNMINKENYIQQPMETSFLSALNDFLDNIPAIVRVMVKYQSISRAEFDMESIEIDANGNRIRFSNGFENYHLEYDVNNNRIANITSWNDSDSNSQKTKYEVKHNGAGNMIQNFHKGIWYMTYHPVSNRMQKVLMVNGNVIEFSYDSKGERILKRVKNERQEIISEMHYYRDEYGRTLVERKLTYVTSDLPPDVVITAYIYGPKSLIGFVRRDQFYSVFTDHQGSVRLIIRDGEVVAAYDYSPYGEIMRAYEGMPEACIPYRFTAQEWDPEIGLYNFHARFYDPTIGRFYQTDPLMQFFNPYKYADNAPISIIDPNGEKAFKDILHNPMSFAALVLICSIAGAYLAGADANNSFFPWQWDWTRRETYMAIFYGGVTGALIPVGLYNSMNALGQQSLRSAVKVTSIGLTFAYMNAATSNNGNLNFKNWNYLSPRTWWAAFEGFSLGVGILGGLHDARTKFITLSRRQKYLFGGTALSYGAFSFTMGGIKTDWDIRRVEFWSSTITSIVTATDLPAFMKNAFRFNWKYGKRFFSQDAVDVAYQFSRIKPIVMERLRKNNFNLLLPLEIYKLNGAIAKAIISGGKIALGMITFTSLLSTVLLLINGDFDHWDLTKLNTYHNLLTAMQLTTKFYDIAKFPFIAAEQQKTIFKLNLRALSYKKEIPNFIVNFYRQNWKKLPSFQIKMKRSIDQNDDFLFLNSKLGLSFRHQSITLVFTRNRFFNPSFILDVNKIKYNNSNIIAHNITKALAATMETMKKQIEIRICQEMIIGDGAKFKAFYNEDAMMKCEKNIHDSFQYNINKAYIVSLLNNFTADENITACDKEKELFTVEKDLQQNYLNFENKRDLLARKKYLKIAIKNKKRLRNIKHAIYISDLSEIIWNKFVEYRDSLQIWSFTHCSEPPLLAPPFSGELTKQYIPVPNAYDPTRDLTLLSSYESEDIPILQSFQQCYNCLNTTSSVRNIIQEDGWLSTTKYNNETNPNTNSKRRRRRSLSSLTKKCPYATQKIHTNDSSWDILEIGDSLISKIGINEILLLSQLTAKTLLGVKCRKRRVRKSLANNVSTTSYIEKEIFACDLVELYDKYLQDASKVIGIELVSNSFELFKEVIHMIETMDLDGISFLMEEYALKTIDDFKNKSNGKFNYHKLQKLTNFFSKLNLNTKINEYLKTKVYKNS